MQREVTERDFRADQFKDAKVEDYEFRADGALVRKDRWERGMFAVALAAGFSTRPPGFEIDDVVKAVERVMDGWSRVDDEDYQPTDYKPIDLKLPDGSVLISCEHWAGTTYRWGEGYSVSLETAEYWRPSA